MMTMMILAMVISIEQDEAITEDEDRRRRGNDGGLRRENESLPFWIRLLTVFGFLSVGVETLRLVLAYRVTVSIASNRSESFPNGILSPFRILVARSCIREAIGMVSRHPAT